jgi:uncharacterized protein DUF6429
MDYDTSKVDEVVLALLHLNAHTDHGITRAWKGFDWEAMDRLHTQGFISDPKSKAKSVVFTDAGARKAEELFRGTLAKPYNRPLQPAAGAGVASSPQAGAAAERPIR